MDRVGAGFIAILSSLFFAMFDITASILVLIGFLIFRWAVIAAPILGTLGLLRPASSGLRRLANAVIAAVFNIIIFGTGAAVYLFAVDLIMSTTTLPGWLQVVLMWLVGVVGWLLLAAVPTDNPDGRQGLDRRRDVRRQLASSVLPGRARGCSTRRCDCRRDRRAAVRPARSGRCRFACRAARVPDRGHHACAGVPRHEPAHPRIPDPVAGQPASGPIPTCPTRHRTTASIARRVPPRTRQRAGPHTDRSRARSTAELAVREMSGPVDRQCPSSSRTVSASRHAATRHAGHAMTRYCHRESRPCPSVRRSRRVN